MVEDEIVMGDVIGMIGVPNRTSAFTVSGGAAADHTREDGDVTTKTEFRAGPEHVLTLDRVLDAPVEKLWRCWVEPGLLKQWFCPRPWYVSDVRMDLRPGGEFTSVMHGPSGESFVNAGVFLEVEPRRRLVSTDALLPGWGAK